MTTVLTLRHRAAIGLLIFAIWLPAILKGQTITELLQPTQFPPTNYFVPQNGQPYALVVPPNPSTNTLALAAWWQVSSADGWWVQCAIYDAEKGWVLTESPPTEFSSVGATPLYVQAASDAYGNVIVAWNNPSNGSVNTFNIEAGSLALSDFTEVEDTTSSVFSLKASQSELDTGSPLFILAYGGSDGNTGTINLINRTFAGPWSPVDSVSTVPNAAIESIDASITLTNDTQGILVTWISNSTSNVQNGTTSVAATFSNSPNGPWLVNNLVEPLELTVGANYFVQSALDLNNIGYASWLTINYVNSPQLSFIAAGMAEPNNWSLPIPEINLGFTEANINYNQPVMVALNTNTPAAEALCITVKDPQNYFVLPISMTFTQLPFQFIATQGPTFPASPTINFAPNLVASTDSQKLIAIWQNIVLNGTTYTYEIATATSSNGIDFTDPSIISTGEVPANYYIPQVGINANGDVFGLWAGDIQFSGRGYNVYAQLLGYVKLASKITRL